MRAILWLPVVAVLILIPTQASAVTLEQVVSLAHAGVTDAVILALIATAPSSRSSLSRSSRCSARVSARP